VPRANNWLSDATCPGLPWMTRPVPAFFFDFQLPTYKITQLPNSLYRDDPHRWKDQEI